jgi:uncharacterized RDD family membrane protein YckC
LPAAKTPLRAIPLTSTDEQDEDTIPDALSGSTLRGVAPPPGPPGARAAEKPKASDVSPRASRHLAAGFWRRLLAALVDSAIILPVSLALAWGAGAAAGIQLPATSQSGVDFWLDLLLGADPALLGFVILLATIAAAYSLIFESTLSRTPGMMMAGARIIDVYGDSPGVGRVLLRTIGYGVSAATLGLGFLWIGVDARKRSLHDWISGTHVIKI